MIPNFGPFRSISHCYRDSILGQGGHFEFFFKNLNFEKYLLFDYYNPCDPKSQQVTQAYVDARTRCIRNIPDASGKFLMCQVILPDVLFLKFKFNENILRNQSYIFLTHGRYRDSIFGQGGHFDFFL